MTARDARLEIINGLKNVAGLRATPTKIPDGVNPFPFAVAHLGDGVFELSAASLKVGLHNIIVEVHVGRQNLGADYDVIEPLVDSCVSQWMTMLKNKNNANGFNSIETFEQITYSLEPAEWASIATLAIIFTIVGCKVQDAV